MNQAIFLVGILLVTQTVSASDRFWGDLAEEIRNEACLSDLGQYGRGFELYYFQSFLPVELYRFYEQKGKWFYLHSTIRRTSSKASLFDDDQGVSGYDVQTKVFEITIGDIENFETKLVANSFYTFRGDESERQGLDGSTMYFQYLKASGRESFSYWNAGGQKRTGR